MTTAPPGSGWAFSTLGCSGASVWAIVATADQYGCAGVEVRTAPDEAVHLGLADDERDELAQSVRTAGLTVLALNSYVSLCAPFSGGARDEYVGNDEQVPALAGMVALARDLGALGVRVFMHDDEPPGAELTAGERRAISRVAAISAHCRDADVRVLIETHDSHSRGDRLARVLAVLDAEVPGHPCAVVWDTAHSWGHGEEPARTLELLSPWLSYIQVKDVRSAGEPRPVMLGDGGYPIGRLGAALVAAGWAGWVSLEWERKWHPSLPVLEMALARLRRWAAALPGA